MSEIPQWWLTRQTLPPTKKSNFINCAVVESCPCKEKKWPLILVSIYSEVRHQDALNALPKMETLPLTVDDMIPFN